ncbi:MAG: hypothetical protein K1X67_21510 [Fimbriimonadaceae bacterium]|nr:hypothetical protein [Fimbriimonadaceae bacterium]
MAQEVESGKLDMESERSRLRRQALREPITTVGLVMLGIVSIGIANPIPFLAGLVAQGMFVGLAPHAKWYRERIAIQAEKVRQLERQALRAHVLPRLDAIDHNRYILLEQRRDAIATYSTGREGYEDVVGKLNDLLDQFLRFAAQRDDYGDYLCDLLDGLKPPQVQPRRSRFVNPMTKGISDEWIKESVEKLCQAYDVEMTDLLAKLSEAEEENLHNRALFEMRVDVLAKRRGHVDALGEILVNLSHQLHLLEDTFGLISDEQRARSPEQVLAEIDDVVTQSDTLSQRLSDITLAPVEFDDAEEPHLRQGQG